MFKRLGRSLGKLFSNRVLTALRRDVSSGGYVEDRDFAAMQKTKKPAR